MHRPTLLAAAVALFILIALGIWFFLFRAAPPSSISTGTPTASETETISDHGMYHDIDAKSPGAVPLANAAASAKAKATMDMFVRTEVGDFKRNNVDTLTAADIQMMGLGGERKYGLGIGYDVYTGRHTVSYVFTVFVDTMGAHPNTYYRTFTFDAATGTELELADLFTSASYLETMSTLSRNQLIPSIAQASNVSTSEIDTSYINSGTEPVAANFQWFFINGTQLTLIFPPYQVGPYALGMQSVTFQLSSLPDIQTAYK